MERNKLILLLVAFIGIPGLVWYSRSQDKPDTADEADFGIKIGEHIPELTLTNDLDHEFQENFPRGRNGTVLFFWHSQCPVVRTMHQRFEELITRYSKRGFEFYAIDSEPLDTKDDIKAVAEEWGVTYTVLRDSKRQTANALGVSRAGTFLVFDREATLLYRGAFDDGNKPPKIGFVHSAISASLADAKVGAKGIPSAGCEYSAIK